MSLWISEKTVVLQRRSRKNPKTGETARLYRKYMIKQPVSAGFGFIVPEEELEAHLEDKEGNRLFQADRH